MTQEAEHTAPRQDEGTQPEQERDTEGQDAKSGLPDDVPISPRPGHGGRQSE